MSKSISIDDAVKRARLLAQIRHAGLRARNDYSIADDLIIQAVKLRLPREAVAPLMDEFVKSQGERAWTIYNYNARFNPPRAEAPAAAPAPPDSRPDFTYETGEGCVRFQGIDLETALHGPITPRPKMPEEAAAAALPKDGVYIDDRRTRGFPFAQVFAKLKVADRTAWDYKTKQDKPAGIYIKPWHDHEPGAQCCYAVDEPDDTVNRGTGDGAFGCEDCDEDGRDDGVWNGTDLNAYQLTRYLEKGLITLDEIRPLLYGQLTGEVTTGTTPDLPAPDLPTGVYPDKTGLGLFVLDGLEPVRVCNTVYPVAEVDDERGQKQGRLIRFRGDDFGWRLHVIPARLLESEGAALFQDLTNNGLTVNSAPLARAAFRDLVKSPKLIGERVTQYSRPGWHGHRYVLPTGFSLSAKEIGATQVLVARSGATVDQNQGGSFEAWREGVASEIWKGDCPQFAMGQLSGMCGVVTSLLMLDHPVVHFSGPPASGKSTAQIIAAGMTANPAPGQGTLVELQQDVEAVLPKGVGTCAHIDDPTKHGSPTTVERLMYRAMSCCPFTVSSVASLEQIVERAGGKMDEGIRRRVLTVDTRKAPRIDPWRAADIKAAAQANYGHAAPCFLDHLLTKGGTLDRDKLLKEVRTNARAYLGVSADGETVSAATHVGLLQMVGEMMQDAGLVPGDADVVGLLKGVWADWIARRNASPVDRAIADLDTALADAESLGDDPDGLCWSKDGIGYLPTATIEEIIGSEIKASTVMRHLKDAGRLVTPGSGRNLTWPNLPGSRDGRVQCPHYRVKLAA